MFRCDKSVHWLELCAVQLTQELIEPAALGRPIFSVLFR